MAEDKVREALGGLLERLRVVGLNGFADELQAALAANTPDEPQFLREQVAAKDKRIIELLETALSVEDGRRDELNRFLKFCNEGERKTMPEVVAYVIHRCLELDPENTKAALAQPAKPVVITANSSETMCTADAMRRATAKARGGDGHDRKR